MMKGALAAGYPPGPRHERHGGGAQHALAVDLPPAQDHAGVEGQVGDHRGMPGEEHAEAVVEIDEVRGSRTAIRGKTQTPSITPRGELGVGCWVLGVGGGSFRS